MKNRVLLIVINFTLYKFLIRMFFDILFDCTNILSLALSHTQIHAKINIRPSLPPQPDYNACHVVPTNPFRQFSVVGDAMVLKL